MFILYKTYKVTLIQKIIIMIFIFWTICKMKIEHKIFKINLLINGSYLNISYFYMDVLKSKADYIYYQRQTYPSGAECITFTRETYSMS